MITDRNEAFMHNSCKKLAQLGKVIFQMETLYRDRKDEMMNITVDYESTINQLVRQHQKSIEQVAKNLVAFRKSCIDKSCQEYGVQYKEIKTNLTNLYKNKINKLQDIMNQWQSMVSAIEQIDTNSRAELNQFIESIDSLESSLKASNKRPKTATSKQINKMLQPIIEKIESFKSQHDEQLKQIRNEHAQNIKKNRAEIYSILKQEITTRTDDFHNYQSSLAKLKADVNNLRKEYMQLSKIHDENSSQFRSNRNFLISSNKNSFHEISNKLLILVKNEKHNQSQRQFQLSEFNKLKSTLINQHQNELNSLRSQVTSQQNQSLQLAESKAIEVGKRNQALESMTNSLKREFEANHKMKKDFYEQIEGLITQSQTDITMIKEHLQSIIDESTNKETNRSLELQTQNERELGSLNIQYERHLADFRKSAKDRIGILNCSLKIQDDLSHETQKQMRKNINDLLENLKSLQSKLSNEIEEKKKKDEKEKADYLKANEMRQANRKTEIENSIIHKQKDKEKIYMSTTQKFQSELATKKLKYEKENSEKLKEMKDNLESTSTSNQEINQHKTDLMKIQAKLKVTTDSLEKVKQEREQRLSILQNEISNCEKTIRQIQRKIKTETQAIDDEYEMKIQVEQVKLNNAIENISKLYEKDENLRGVEYVEAVRKLRDIQNRSVDLQLKKKHEIEDENKSFLNEKEKIENEITFLKNETKMKELKEKLNKCIDNSNQELHSLEIKTQTNLEKLIDQSNSIQNEQITRITHIKLQIDQEKNEFQTKSGEIEQKLDKIKEDEKSKIAEYQLQFDSKQKEQIDKHNDQVSKLKIRIESALKTQREASLKVKDELTAAKKDDNDLISRKLIDEQEFRKKVSSDFLSKDEKFTISIKELIQKVADYKIKFFNAPIKKSDQTRIDSSIDTLKTKNKELGALFDTFYSNVEKIKTSAIHQHLSQPMQFAVRPSNSRRTTRSTRSEGIKTHDSSKKHMPALTMPQIL